MSTIQIPGLANQAHQALPPNPAAINPGALAGITPDALVRLIPGMSEEAAKALLAQVSSGQVPIELLMGASKYLLSICPWELESPYFFHGGGRRKYSIPACKKGEYQVLAVTNTFTRIMDTNLSEEEIASNGHAYSEKRIAAQQIVNDLIEHFAGHHPANRAGGGCSIGVIQIAGPTPTPAELKHVIELQTKFFRELVKTADDHFTKGKQQLIITEHHRALEWLQAEDPKRHPWHIDIGEGTPAITCPACSGMVVGTAYICAACRTDLADYYMRRALKVDPKLMPGVAEEIRFRRSEQALKAEAEHIRQQEQKSAAVPSPAPTPSTHAGQVGGTDAGVVVEVKDGKGKGK